MVSAEGAEKCEGRGFEDEGTGCRASDAGVRESCGVGEVGASGW